MLRIVALNQVVQDDEPEKEMTVTKEAEETIAESEYIKSIKLIAEGKSDLALDLLTNLLETKVLSEITPDPANEKLYSIRYNCHKNIAFIFEETNQAKQALHNYVQAMNIDESDVYTMHRCGQLALQMNALDLAHLAFENCLKRNPSHWSAADGMLQTLWRSGNVLGAYGWANKLYCKDPSYMRAIVTLRHIFARFKGSMPLFEKFFGPYPICDEIADGPSADDLNANELWPPAEAKMFCPDATTCANLSAFRVQHLDWDTVGQYIVAVHDHLQKTEQSMLFALNLADIIAESAPSDVKQVCNTAATEFAPEFHSNSAARDSSDDSFGERPSEPQSKSETVDDCGEVGTFMPPALDHGGPKMGNLPTRTSAAQPEANDDSDSNTKPDGGDGQKTKQRRRCSDLLFLEQWGWHKNRRYSRRKKSQPDRPDSDTSLTGFLRKVFVKHMDKTFEDAWPFRGGMESIATGSPQDGPNEATCVHCGSLCGSVESFQAATALAFERLVRKLQAKPFDLPLLAYKWLKYLSTCWDKPLPPALRSLYLQVFKLYLLHFELDTWHQLSEPNFEASYRVCLLALELDSGRQRVYKSDASSTWKNVFDHLSWQACHKRRIVSGNQAGRPSYFQLRLVHLEYLVCADSAQLRRSVLCLEVLEAMLDDESDSFKLHLPNVDGNCIAKTSIRHRRIELQRQIRRIEIPKLYEAGKWSDLCAIIGDSLAHMAEQCESVDWIMDFQVQVEVMLEALQQQNAPDELLRWTEQFLHYAAYRFVGETRNSPKQRLWERIINFVLSHLEANIRNEGFDIVSILDEKLARMISNLTRILAYHLDSGVVDKQNGAASELNIRRPFVVLHQLAQREAFGTTGVVAATTTCDSEEDDDRIPHTYMMLFTAHEHLGKRQLCTKDAGELLLYTLDTMASNLRAPLFDRCRGAIGKYIEQVTYCLYGYPPKKGKSRHLEDHEAVAVELTWPRAIQLFDLYCPESLPEFNSYKVKSISNDMEQMLLKILALMPKELDPAPSSAVINKFIRGWCDVPLLDEEDQEGGHSKNVDYWQLVSSKLPYKVKDIFYLLADYYFKNRDFSKSIKYYTLDLACNRGRFDSWAGMSLSMASKIETQLNTLAPICPNEVLRNCEETMRCFQRCISLNESQTLLWIEYGALTYTIHSFCCRLLKSSPERLDAKLYDLVVERKHKMLDIAHDCFELAARLQSIIAEPVDDESDDAHEERWLPQYMLGKIAEKRKNHPSVYLKYYLNAANYLYESSAAYPIKINHSHPAALCVEALEVFYRTNAAIIKYLECEQAVPRDVGDLFNKVLTELANSPFAYNKAKINGNALKRKIGDKEASISQSSLPAKIVKGANPATLAACSPSHPAEATAAPAPRVTSNKPPSGEVNVPLDSTKGVTKIVPNDVIEADPKDPKRPPTKIPSRRESQESGATATNTTVTSMATSSSSSSASSSSDSDSESDVSSGEKSKKCDINTPYTAKELEDILKAVVQNLEECAIRFSEHFKSIYRLVHHYVHAPPNLRDYARAEQLLLGQYTTTVANRINGLFYDRKNNKNFFNGIWRNPSSEIDRPGSFSAHLVKCVTLLIELLTQAKKPTQLVDVGLQLYKTPDIDKRYIPDSDRIKLYQLAITNCAKTLRGILNDNRTLRNDAELLNLIIDVYKIHKQCVKYITQKEPLFTDLLVDAYRLYIMDKVEYLPVRVNFLDLAIKLCLQEIAERKTMIRPSTSQAMPTVGTVKNIPGLILRRSYVERTSPGMMNLPMALDSFAPDATTVTAPLAPDFSPNVLISMMTPEGAMHFQKMLEGHYRQLFASNIQSTAATVAHSATLLPPETTITPSMITLPAFNQVNATLTKPELFDRREFGQMLLNVVATEEHPSQMTTALPGAAINLAAINLDPALRDTSTCSADNKVQIKPTTTTAKPKQDTMRNPYGRLSKSVQASSNSSESSEDSVIVTADSSSKNLIEVIILE